MEPQELYLKQCEAVSSMMTRLYDTRLTTTSGGNISLRLGDGLFCITPSGLDKFSLRPSDIAIVTLDGENLTPGLGLSIESEMHRLILRSRPDINAVIHAHPCWSTLFSALGDLSINTALTAESFFLLGEPVVIPYHMMGTPELAQEVASCLRNKDVGILENHGVITVGRTLVSAFDLIEVLENASKMTLASRLLEGKACVRPLDETRRRELVELRSRSGR